MQVLIAWRGQNKRVKLFSHFHKGWFHVRNSALVRAVIAYKCKRELLSVLTLYLEDLGELIIVAPFSSIDCVASAVLKIEHKTTTSLLPPSLDPIHTCVRRDDAHKPRKEWVS